jgi:hypothetical protein
MNFVNKLQDSIDVGIGNLVDADLAKKAPSSSPADQQQLGCRPLVSSPTHLRRILSGLFAKGSPERRAPFAAPGSQLVAGGFARPPVASKERRTEFSARAMETKVAAIAPAPDPIRPGQRPARKRARRPRRPGSGRHATGH